MEEPKYTQAELDKHIIEAEKACNNKYMETFIENGKLKEENRNLKIAIKALADNIKLI